MAFALSNVLRALEAPYAPPPKAMHHSLPPEIAVKKLRAALTAKRVEIRHVVPLDMAEDLPELRFGSIMLRRFEPSELDDLTDLARV